MARPERRGAAVATGATPELDPRTLEQEAEPMMRFYMAYVRNGRLVLDKPTNLPEGRRLELVPIGPGQLVPPLGSSSTQDPVEMTG